MLIRTFFGWNWKKVIHNENSWFVKELSNTWNNTQNNSWSDITTIPTNTQPESTSTEYTKINIMMPKYFYNSERKTFEEDLYNDQKIQTNFIFIDNLNSYKELLINPDFSGAELFLFPYDRNETINTRTISFGENIGWYFDELISPIVKDQEIWFFPFSIDPMIMYSSIDLTQNNFSEISDLIYNRNPKIQLAFPIFFWITNEDYDNKWFLREYQDIVRYALLHYFRKYQDSKSLWTRINTNILEGSDEIRNYNISDLNQISNIISQPECKYFPSICFQIYNFVWIRFWFLSDTDIVQVYFSHKKSNFENISKMKMPFSNIETPIRIWWRWISDDIKNPNIEKAIYKFITQYINNHDKYNLRNSTLPAFKKEWDSLTNNQYIWARWYLLETWWDYINTLRNTKNFRQLIEHQISAEDFLRKI